MTLVNFMFQHDGRQDRFLRFRLLGSTVTVVPKVLIGVLLITANDLLVPSVDIIQGDIVIRFFLCLSISEYYCIFDRRKRAKLV